MDLFLLLAVCLPVAAGAALLLTPVRAGQRAVSCFAACAMPLCALAAGAAIAREGAETVLGVLIPRLPIVLRPDALGRLFAAVVTVIWLCAGVFALAYLRGDRHKRRFFGFYFLVYGVLLGLDFAGNLVTFYLFYELMTLASFPLVLHDRSRAAVMAGLKYLFYSLCGAYGALFGVYCIFRHGRTLDFTPGGVLDPAAIQTHPALLLGAACAMLLGFGVKAGLFPLHGWLPTAHPAAPAPASALLSGVIVKSGILGLLRTVYFVFGADFLRGSWVQTTVLTLSLVTVFLGSMLACLERGLKKRLAYSTVSQLSYIIFGLMLLVPQGAQGALEHTAFHAVMKCCLFLCAGAVIHQTGRTQVAALRGLGRAMPLTFGCFTVCSLGLVGIPPLSGFVSKWDLCIGALDSGTGWFAVAGPVVLLVSALLTAGYLLPIAADAFLPGRDAPIPACREGGACMVLPMLVLAGLTILFGLMPQALPYVQAACALLK